jgi:alanine racemase
LEPDTRRAWVEVDLAALERNAMAMAQRAQAPLLPMVKSDAYGLGVEAVVARLERLAPWGYGVATVDEGAQLRRLGITRPVLVFTPVLTADFADLRAHGLIPTLGDAARIDAWRSSGGGTWHLAIDTGMSRAGVPWDAVAPLVPSIAAHPPDGAFTHFHSAEQGIASIAIQQHRFRQAIDILPARPRYLHAENSPGIERQSPSPWDLARPGVFLYGVGSGAGVHVAAEPVASLHARVVELRDIRAGESVSYGATWRATRPSRIATVAAGYADGVRRGLSNRGVALVRERVVKIAGVVTMDMTMLDVTDAPCNVGDVATFLGRQGASVLDAGEVASAGGLSPYELLVGLRLRAPHRYVGA